MKKLFALIFLFTLFSIPAYAADYYIAQTAAGSGDASSCANAKIYSWNWTSPTVNDGDTVHLCGTITSTLTIPKSGTSAGITVKFESGANLTSAAWGTTSSSAIYASGISYIIIDGNNTGVIANTNNGDALGVQQTSSAIYVSGGSYWTVKNLTVQNMYIPISGIAYDTVALGGYNIYLFGVSNVSVYGNTLSNNYYGIQAGTLSSNVSTVNIYSNTISACSSPLTVGLGNNGTSLDTVNIYGNTITYGTNWYDTPDNNHVTGIHIFGRSGTSDAITNLKIYGNNIGGDGGGHITAGTQLEYNIVSPLVYNNVYWDVNHAPGDGFIYVKGGPLVVASNARIYNNTMAGNASGLGITLSNVTGISIYNNIIYNTDYGITYDAGSTLAGSNYNDISLTGNQNNTFQIAGVAKTWAQWQTAGWDANSITTQPPFVSSSNFNLTSSIPGTNLSTYFTTDYTGATRSEWDIGAYEYQGGTSHTLSVTTSHGNVISGDGYINCTDNASHGGGACSYNYTSGSITLTASADGSYTFTGWSGGGCSGVGACTVTMNSSQSVTASYSIASVTPPSVTISTPSQTIPSNSLAISGTATQGTNPISSCAWSIGTPLSGTNAGTAMTGTTSWSSSSNITSFSAGANTLYVGCVDNAGYWGNSSIVVTYTQIYNLSAVTTHGTVTSSPAGISCTDNTCNHSFTSQSVTLTESPDAGYTFSSWTVSGVPIVSGCTTGSTCVVTTNAIGTVTATYVGTPYNITVSQTYTGLTSCGSLNNLGVNQVTSNGSLTVTATLPTGCQLAWSGTGSGSVCTGHALTCTVSNPSGDGTVIGTFTPMYSYGGGTHTGGSRR